MVDVECMKKRHEDGRSIRRIARQLEMSRQAVRKVLGAEGAKYPFAPLRAPPLGGQTVVRSGMDEPRRP